MVPSADMNAELESSMQNVLVRSKPVEIDACCFNSVSKYGRFCLASIKYLLEDVPILETLRVEPTLRRVGSMSHVTCAAARKRVT